MSCLLLALPRRFLYSALLLLLVCGSSSAQTGLAQADPDPASAAAVTGRLLYHPYLPHYSDGRQATVDILNVGLQAVQLSVHIYHPNGAFAKTITTTLASLELFTVDLAAQTDLPDDDYTMILEADGPLTSLVEVQTPQRADSTVGGLGLYQGIAQPCIELVFGPFYGHPKASQLVLMSRTVATATVNLSFFDQGPNAVVTTTLNLAPLGSVQISAPAGLPTDFAGIVLARATRPLTGVLIQQRTGDGIALTPGAKACSLAVRNATQTTLRHPIPRLAQSANFGGGPRVTTLFAAYAGEGMLTGGIERFSPSGEPLVPVILFSLTAKAHQQIMPPDGIDPLVTALISTDHPLVLTEQTDFRNPSPYSIGTYAQVDLDGCANRLLLPAVKRQPDRYSVLYVQNIDLDSAGVSLTFRDRTAHPLTSVEYEITPNGMHAFDLRQVSGLPQDFVGSVELFTPHRLLCAQVDEFLVGQPATNPNVNPQTPVYLPAIFTP
jgi:hypothetical protein